MDPALKDVGKKEGLEIWRVNKFKLEKLPKSQYGIFYKGDSYVVMNTKHSEAWDIHFWLGQNTSIDEQGTAAIKAVEIDNSLNGIPVQHREVQGHESPLFLSYFKKGIRYMDGGYDSGFDHINDKFENFKPRLLKCKGKRNVRVTQVELSPKSMNLGDVFILDLGLKIYVWMPPGSGRLERIKGIELAQSIQKSERNGRPEVILLDSDYDNCPEFWQYFGGTQTIKTIKKADDVESDENYWRDNRQKTMLWRVSDSSGQVKVTLTGESGLDKSKLDTNDAFIVDTVGGGIYVWLGKGCTSSEKKKAMVWAEKYLQQANRPPWTQVTMVIEDAEPADFVQWFSGWKNPKKTQSFEPKLFQCSNESGKLTVEEIKNFTQEDLDGDDVMILDGGNQIFVWVGAGANKEEKESAKVTAKKYLDTDTLPRSKHASYEVIFQTKEPTSFKKYFSKWDDELFKNDARSIENIRKLIFA
uniref:Gelsolin-like protein 1 (inferred by orthology to a C. elegans protein) n=1 Tax=Strongyloides venezuelensis TaxID=75913 RepID=A0A0K0FS95_STRVS